MANKNVQSKYIVVPNEAPKISVNLVVRTIIYLIVIINSVAAFFGFDVNIVANEDFLYEAFTLIADIIAFFHAYWRNNDITRKARIKAIAAKQVEEDLDLN